MNRNSNKTIEAIVKIDSFEITAPWEVAENKFFYTRLFAGMDEAEIGSIMLASIFPLTDEMVKENAADTLRAFVDNEEGFVLGGGLLFKENGAAKVSPGCCGGLEDWRDWFAVANGSGGIWTGHDPESLIEKNDRLIKIWNDAETKDDEFSIELMPEEFIRLLELVERDLTDFLDRLRRWTTVHATGMENEVVDYFAKNMNI
ncbi:MAG TPA: hypothetical protein VIL74_25530 [Pyrinomonadaceae bacterium]|jgi:hypothetical protein